MATQQGKVLIVEDEVTNIMVLEALLTRLGYEVTTASSGEEALQLVSREKPDVILSDVMMTSMDGYTVCRRLKENPETFLIPVVLMTALDRVEDRIEGIEAGADDFLTKPINRDELVARIRTLLRKKAAIERYINERETQSSRLVLDHSPLFEGLSRPILEEIAKQMRPRHFDPDAFLCRQGDPGESLFVIQQGFVEVLIDTADGMTPLNWLRQGDVVGEMALVSGDARIASVVARQPTDVLELTYEAFASIVAQHPAIVVNISRITIQRLQGMNKRNIVESTSSPLPVLEQVFISHSSLDKETATTVCDILEAEGIRCWIAPRDVPPGARFGEAIVQAIEQSAGVVLIFSEHANASEHVMNEVERAVNHQKLIFPIRIDQATASAELAYFISRRHWLDACDAPLAAVVKRLATALQAI